MKSILVFTQFIFLSQVSSSAQSYHIPNGTSQTITEHSICRTVTNNSGNNLFVSTNSPGSWSSFFSNSHSGVTVTTCCVAGSQSFTTSGTTAFNVPSGCTLVTVKAWGGGGGSGGYSAVGGGGGFARANLTVTSGETLTVYVGGGGSRLGNRSGGSGGGFSGVFRSVSPLVIAGGGGGGGGSQTFFTSGDGGPGGGTVGVAGGGAGGGGAGTQSAGGNSIDGEPLLAGPSNGSSLQGGVGEDGDDICSGAPGGANGGGAGGSCGATAGKFGGTVTNGGGGGGGGYYGGGGGQFALHPTGGSGGGGGSSFVTGTLTSVISGIGALAGNNSDPDYIAGTGMGSPGILSTNGTVGMVHISW